MRKKGSVTIGSRSPNGMHTTAPGESPVLIQLTAGGQIIAAFTDTGECRLLGEPVRSLVTDLRAWRKPPKT